MSLLKASTPLPIRASTLLALSANAAPAVTSLRIKPGGDMGDDCPRPAQSAPPNCPTAVREGTTRSGNFLNALQGKANNAEHLYPPRRRTAPTSTLFAGTSFATTLICRRQGLMRHQTARRSCAPEQPDRLSLANAATAVARWAQSADRIRKAGCGARTRPPSATAVSLNHVAKSANAARKPLRPAPPGAVIGAGGGNRLTSGDRRTAPRPSGLPTPSTTDVCRDADRHTCRICTPT